MISSNDAIIIIKAIGLKGGVEGTSMPDFGVVSHLNTMAPVGFVEMLYIKMMVPKTKVMTAWVKNIFFLFMAYDMLMLYIILSV